LIQAKVIHTWQELSRGERKEIRRRSMRASDGVMRCRCKVILSLVQGKTPTIISRGGRCAKSQVYRVAGRFIEHGLVGLADRREDNGENKVTDAYGMELLHLIEGPPQEHGYRRPTWTQELLVLAKRTGIRFRVNMISRLLRRLGVRLNRPKPTVGYPWPRSRRTRRLRAIQRLVDNLAPSDVALYLDEVDIHLNPKIGPEWTLGRKQKYVRTPGCNEKRYLAGALDPKTGKLT
jgi:putative transposase